MRSGLLKAALVLFSVCFFSCASGGGAKGSFGAEYMELGDGYAGLSKYDKAALFYQKAAAAPEYRNAAEYSLARVKALSGDWVSAIPLLEGLLSRDSENLLVSSALAYAYAASGKTESALSTYEALWQRFSDDPVSGLNYVDVLRIAGEKEKALAVLEEIKNRFPDTDQQKRIEEIATKLAASEETPESSSTEGAAPDFEGERAPTSGAPEQKPSEADEAPEGSPAST